MKRLSKIYHQWQKREQKSSVVITTYKGKTDSNRHTLCPIIVIVCIPKRFKSIVLYQG